MDQNVTFLIQKEEPMINQNTHIKKKFLYNKYADFRNVQFLIFPKLGNCFLKYTVGQ